MKHFSGRGDFQDGPIVGKLQFVHSGWVDEAILDVRDFRITKDSTKDLVKQMKASGGFTAKKLAVAVEITQRMIKDEQSLNFLSFPADLVATGTRGILRDMVRKKWFDVIVTTCGTIDHDIARSFGEYQHGSFDADDTKLKSRGIHRLGNIFIPSKAYGVTIERKMIEWLESLVSSGKNELSTSEICAEIGARLGKDSILYWAWRNNVPVIVPGITDGAVGYQIWQFSQSHRFRLNLLKDEQILADRVFEARRSGALILGGGISKHHVIWWNAFKDGLDYAVYITTAQEFDGSLSGARLKEAISWGKLKKHAMHVTVDGDITLCLPLLYSSMVS
jgi:deoxyhypusine synthase